MVEEMKSNVHDLESLEREEMARVMEQRAHEAERRAETIERREFEIESRSAGHERGLRKVLIMNSEGETLSTDTDADIQRILAEHDIELPEGEHTIIIEKRITRDDTDEAGTSD